MGAMMMRNMGNGAAVGDYDADADLDVLLLGQHGMARPAVPQRPASRTGPRAFTDVTEAAGLGDTGLVAGGALRGPRRRRPPDLLLVNDTDPDGKPTRHVSTGSDGDGTFRT